MKTIRYIFIVLFVSSANNVRSQENAYEQLMLLSNILNHVKSNYIEEKKQNELIHGAIRGVLGQLDPFTTYLDPVQYKNFTGLMDGKAYGFGIEFEIIDGFPTVIAIISGSPAEKKNIRTGDLLISVDGRPTEGLKSTELQFLQYDKKASKAKLKFLRFRDRSEYEIEIKRSILANQTVSKSIVDGRIGYIKISHFSTSTAEEFERAMEFIEKKDISRLVIDLRDNPGGIVDAALSIADRFIPEGELLIELKGRKAEFNRKISATGVKKFNGYVAVLVGHGSASAAEILAGILQDHDRAVLIGTNTFGKAYVQTDFMLSNGGFLIMTIGKYYLPSGRTIQRDFHEKSIRMFYEEILDTDSLIHLAPYDFKTKAGRPVQAGIGLMPDSFVVSGKEPDWFDEFLSENHLVKMVSQYIAAHESELNAFKDVEEYQKRFKSDPSLVQTFYNMFSKDNVDSAAYADDKELMDIILKIAVAEAFFGNEKALTVRLVYDRAFIKASSVLSR